jgi:hypothetical protein
MSKIAISGPAGGTATYTVTAPTGSVDRTLTLPDQTATLITDSAGVLNIGSGQVYKDASGNVGVGTTSPISKLTVAGSVVLSGGAGSGNSFYPYYNSATSYNAVGSDNNGGMTFITGISSPSIRATIDNAGNLLVGTTTNLGGKLMVSADSTGATYPAVLNNTAGGSGNQIIIELRRAGSQIGSISSTNATTLYNATSDYRLKNSIAPMTGALAKVALFKPCTYKWNVDGSDGQGFIAHELQEVEPGCVTGEKDAVDAEGNPVYQGIDTSFLVATLTAAIQEQQALITALTDRITALEGTQP